MKRLILLFCKKAFRGLWDASDFSLSAPIILDLLSPLSWSVKEAGSTLSDKVMITGTSWSGPAVCKVDRSSGAMVPA